jgi:hypothetical protein
MSCYSGSPPSIVKQVTVEFVHCFLNQHGCPCMIWLLVQNFAYHFIYLSCYFPKFLHGGGSSHTCELLTCDLHGDNRWTFCVHYKRFFSIHTAVFILVLIVWCVLAFLILFSLSGAGKFCIPSIIGIVYYCQVQKYSTKLLSETTWLLYIRFIRSSLAAPMCY